MIEEIIVSGSGGQGVMLLGQVIAYTAIKTGLKATWLPSYGAEMRGGTANCSLVISSEKINSPVVENPSTLICLNQPSMDKFAEKVKEGGLIISNKSLISRCPKNKNLEIFEIKANEIAQKIGSSRVANMILLGTFIAKRPIISIEGAVSSIQAKIGDSNPQIIKLNKQAIEAGYDFVKKEVKL